MWDLKQHWSPVSHLLSTFQCHISWRVHMILRSQVILLLLVWDKLHHNFFVIYFCHRIYESQVTLVCFIFCKASCTVLGMMSSERSHWKSWSRFSLKSSEACRGGWITWRSFWLSTSLAVFWYYMAAMMSIRSILYSSDFHHSEFCGVMSNYDWNQIWWVALFWSTCQRICFHKILLANCCNILSAYKPEPDHLSTK